MAELEINYIWLSLKSCRLQPSLDIQFRTYASRPHFTGYRGHGKRKLILGLGIAGGA